MNLIIVLIGVAFIIGFGAFFIKYARSLPSIVTYSNQSEIEVFGARYKNLYHLMADVSFINTLWEKGCYQTISDPLLSSLIKKAHRMLRFGVIIGALLFFAPLINAVIKIGG